MQMVLWALYLGKRLAEREIDYSPPSCADVVNTLRLPPVLQDIMLMHMNNKFYEDLLSGYVHACKHGGMVVGVVRIGGMNSMSAFHI